MDAIFDTDFEHGSTTLKRGFSTSSGAKLTRGIRGLCAVNRSYQQFNTAIFHGFTPVVSSYDEFTFMTNIELKSYYSEAYVMAVSGVFDIRLEAGWIMIADNYSTAVNVTTIDKYLNKCVSLAACVNYATNKCYFYADSELVGTYDISAFRKPDSTVFKDVIVQSYYSYNDPIYVYKMSIYDRCLNKEDLADITVGFMNMKSQHVLNTGL